MRSETTKLQAVHLHKELMSLRSIKGKVPYQVRIDGDSWRDMDLPADSIDVVAKEAGARFSDILRFETLPMLHAVVLEHHKATKALDPKMFDIADEKYILESFDHDVVKISYEFTVMYAGKDDTERAIKARTKLEARAVKQRMDVSSMLVNNNVPRHVSGKITIMPGN